jgi:FkbM family methyltransferase
MNKLFLKFLNRTHILRSVNTTYKKNGHVIPILGSIGYSNVYGTEKWMKELLKIILQRNDGIFVDVGANLGQTLLKLREVNASIPYVGFEPNPTCVYYVEELIRLNKFKNTTIIPVGISEKTALNKLKIFSDSVDPTASLLDEKAEAIREKIIVTIADDLLSLDKIAILKIDVEGYELFVLQAMKDIIKRDNPIIFIELLPAATADATETRRQRHDKVAELMQELGYTPYLVLKNQNDDLEGLERLEKIKHYDSMQYVDFVFAKGDPLNDLSRAI